MGRKWSKKERGAWTAWRLAIESLLDGSELEEGESLTNRAKEFGRDITDTDSLLAVMLFFDWDEIEKFAKEAK